MSYIYVIDIGWAVKVGISIDPESRASQLGVTMPFTPVVRYRRKRDDVRTVEKLTHRALATKKIRSEWFSVSVEDAVEAIEAVCASIDEPVLPTEMCQSCKPKPLLDKWSILILQTPGDWAVKREILDREDELRELAERTRSSFMAGQPSATRAKRPRTS